MTMHMFDVDDAMKHGVDKAIILQNMRFWLEKNKANGTNLHEGYYWTYNSAKAFATLFPYYKASKIERLLRQMESDGLLLSGNYNKAGYDRTKWYSMPDFSLESFDISQSSNMKNGDCKNKECNLKNCSMQSSDVKNGICKSEAPIPDINTDHKPNINTDSKPDVSAKKKSSKKAVKKLTDYPDDFKPTDKQIAKMNEYGIDIPLFLETFESGAKAKGVQYKCWTSGFTTWINNEIKYNNLVPVPAQEKYEPAFNGWNDRNPDYKPPSQQPDAYHPSHSQPTPSQSAKPNPKVSVMLNGLWFKPLPNMSVSETYEYIKQMHMPGEMQDETYHRLLSQIQGAV